MKQLSHNNEETNRTIKLKFGETEQIMRCERVYSIRPCVKKAVKAYDVNEVLTTTSTLMPLSKTCPNGINT